MVEASNFPERLCQRILLRISREPPHQRRRCDGSRLDRCREAQRFVPVFADDAEIDGAADHGVRVATEQPVGFRCLAVDG